MRRVAAAYRSAFTGIPREVWILAFSLLINRCGTMVLPFMSLYLTRQLGFSLPEAGDILGLYGLGAIVGAYLGGWLADRLGAVTVQKISLAATGIGFLVLGSLRDRLAVSAAVMATSVAAEAFRPALFASIAERTTPAVKTRSFALLRLAVNLGMSIGPVVGGLLAVRHYGTLFVVDAVTCWAAAIFLHFCLPRGRVGAGLGEAAAARTAPGRSGRAWWRDGPFVAFLVLTALLGTVFFQCLGTLPLYLREGYGLAEDGIGILLGINPVIIVAFEMVLMRAIEHLDPMRVTAVGALLVCGGLGLLPLGSSVPFAVVAVLVWTLGEMLTMPMTNAIAARRAGEGRSGSHLGAYTLSFSVGLVAAPVIGTTVYKRLGPNALWLGIAGMGVVLFCAFLLLAGRFRTTGEAPPQSPSDTGSAPAIFAKTGDPPIIPPC